MIFNATSLINLKNWWVLDFCFDFLYYWRLLVRDWIASMHAFWIQQERTANFGWGATIFVFSIGAGTIKFFQIFFHEISSIRIVRIFLLFQSSFICECISSFRLFPEIIKLYQFANRPLQYIYKIISCSILN